MNKDKIFERYKPRYYDMQTKLLESVEQWSEYLESIAESGKKILKQDQIGIYFISTVYLGLDMRTCWGSENGLENALPLIFETMIFCDNHNDSLYGYMLRYTYKEEALYGHQQTVFLVEEALRTSKSIQSVMLNRFILEKNDQKL